MIQITASFDGARTNGDGEVWLKFNAPESQAHKVAPCLFLAKTTVLIVVVELSQGKNQYMGKAQYNGLVHSPQGGYRISVRSTRDLLKTEVDGLFGATFEVKFLEEQEWIALLRETGAVESDADATQQQTAEATFELTV